MSESKLNLYFGCIERVGHYLWEPPNISSHKSKSAVHKWLYNKDGAFAPKDTRKQGLACIRYLSDDANNKKYTIISFWDNSVDNRGGSNSIFLTEGKYDFDEALTIIKEVCPNIFKRFNFPITKYTPKDTNG